MVLNDDAGVTLPDSNHDGDATTDEGASAALAATDNAAHSGIRRESNVSDADPGADADLVALVKVAGTAGDIPTVGQNRDGNETDPASLPSASARPPRFLGDYEILAEVARGGMGIVYRALQGHLGRTVALKLVRDPSLATFAEIRRFRKEAEAVAELDHPNIVPIYDVGQVGDQPYFSMKLIEGGNLARHVGRLKAKPRAAAALMAKVARAVHYAHQRAILHRDLKPSNILIDEHDEPFVTDFGLAKRIEASGSTAQTVTGAIMGTPAYMSPEQAGGGAKTLTTATDVYGLGATLYELLTGAPPFKGDSAAEILRHVIETDALSPRSLVPALDRDLETICLKCLEKAPSRRYGTAENLADDLDRWLTGRPITARRVSRRERTLKWVRRNPALAALIGVSAAALIGLVVGSFYVSYNLNRLLDLAIRDRYSADMNLALRAWGDGETYRSRAYLEKYREPASGLNEYRSFEWYYLWKRCDPELITLAEHGGRITAVAYSANGRIFATGDASGTIRLWDPDRQETVHVLHEHTGPVTELAFLSGDDHLVSGSGDGTARLWVVETGKCSRTLNVGRPLTALDPSPDGNHLAVMTDIEDQVAVYDLARGMSVFVLDPRNEREAGSSKAASSASARATDRMSVASDAGLGHRASRDVKYSKDGSRIYSTHLGGVGVIVWDVRGRRQIKGFTAGTGAMRVDLTGDGRTLAILTENQSVLTCDTTTLEPTDFSRTKSRGYGSTFGGHIALSHTGNLLAYTFGPIRSTEVWNLDANHRIDRYPQGESLDSRCLAFRPDGRRLAIARGNEIVIATVPTREPHAVIASDVGSKFSGLAVRADGARLAWAASGRSEIVVWDPRRRTVVRTLSGHEGGTLALTFGPPAVPNFLASAGADGKVTVQDTQGITPARQMPGEIGVVWDMTFLADGRKLATAGADGMLRVWDLETRTVRVVPCGAGPLQALALTPDGGHVVIAGGDGTIMVWDANNLHRTGTRMSLGGLAHDVAMSPDGAWIAAAGSTAGSGGTVAVWSAASGSLRSSWLTPSAVRCVVFSRDSRRVITGGDEGPLVIWDPTTGRETLQLDGHRQPVMALAAAPGLQIYSAGLDGTVRLWEGLDPGPLPTGWSSGLKEKANPSRPAQR
jgi:WD40 repeat protein/tRNA A-37 threonylcarbamoyl transferase component Bud32